MEVTSLKTLFVISVLTTQMIMPSMPKMPAGMGMPDIGAPTKSMKMDLTSDKKVNAGSKAQCAVPGGLKLGPKVDLQIDLPVKEETAPTTGDVEETSPTAEKLVMKTYWACSDTVVPGQPKIIDTDKMMKGLPSGGMKDMGKSPKMPSMRGFLDYDNKSYAYWPNGKDNKKIVKDSSSPGPYELTTNYCGGTSIKFDPEQEFLSAIEVTSPGKGEIDLSKAIKVEWKPIAGAQAYIITAFASKKGEIVMWTSSSNPDFTVDWNGTAYTKAKIKSYLDNGMLLPATKTMCYIPAGIFQGMSSPMISLTAIGVDRIQSKDGIETNVIIRSTATIMTGGGMGGMTLDEPVPSDDKDDPADDTSDDDSVSSASDEDSTPPPAEKPKSPAQKAKDAVNKLGGIFKR